MLSELPTCSVSSVTAHGIGIEFFKLDVRMRTIGAVTLLNLVVWSVAAASDAPRPRGVGPECKLSLSPLSESNPNLN